MNDTFVLTHEQLIALCKREGKDPRTFFDGILVDEAKETLSVLKSQQETQEQIDNKKKLALGEFKTNLIATVTESIGVMHLAKYNEEFVFGEEVPNEFMELVNDFVDSVEELYFPVEKKKNSKRGTPMGTRINSGTRTKVYVDNVHLPWKNDGTNKYNPWYLICKMIPELKDNMPIYHVKPDALKSHLAEHIPTQVLSALTARNLNVGLDEMTSLSDSHLCEILSHIIGKTVEVR